MLKYGCFLKPYCDIKCVFDNGDVSDCWTAYDLNKVGKGKKDCPHWLPYVECEQCGNQVPIKEVDNAQS